MRQAASNFLFTYWNDLRRERATPVGEQIDPVALNPEIGHIFMLRRESDGTFTVALAGRQCEALSGKPLRGLNFATLWDKADERDISQFCTCVVEGLLPVVIGASVSPEGYAPESLELLLLPLRQINGEPGMILGSMALPPGVRWLGLRPCQPFSLTSHRFLNREASQSTHISHAILRNGHESRKPSSIQPSQPWRRAHLAVYEGGLALKSQK